MYGDYLTPGSRNSSEDRKGAIITHGRNLSVERVDRDALNEIYVISKLNRSVGRILNLPSMI